MHRGIKGIVYDGAQIAKSSEGSLQTTSPVSSAVIYVEDENGPLRKNVTTSKRGEFWRLLLPGNYRVTAFQDICSIGGVILHSATVSVNITKENPLVVQNLVLDRTVPCGIGQQ